METNNDFSQLFSDEPAGDKLCEQNFRIIRNLTSNNKNLRYRSSHTIAC